MPFYSQDFGFDSFLQKMPKSSGFSEKKWNKQGWKSV